VHNVIRPAAVVVVVLLPVIFLVGVYGLLALVSVFAGDAAFVVLKPVRELISDLLTFGRKVMG
jgi:hypothetical protein